MNGGIGGTAEFSGQRAAMGRIPRLDLDIRARILFSRRFRGPRVTKPSSVSERKVERSMELIFRKQLKLESQLTRGRPIVMAPNVAEEAM